MVVSAEALVELTTMLQPAELTFEVPFAVSAPLAVAFNARMQPLPFVPWVPWVAGTAGTPTANALALIKFEPPPFGDVSARSTPENRGTCGCDTTTSTLLLSPPKGQFTVTVTLLAPLT